MKNNGLVDKFLDSYDSYNQKKGQTKIVTVYVRPTKFKSIVGFIFCLIFFVLLITMFTFNLFYFLMLLGSLAATIYYGINLFTPNGIGLPKSFEVPIEEENLQEDINEDDQLYQLDEENYKEKSDRYRVQ